MRTRRCNCHRWFCRVDAACHAIGIHWRWVCDKHDDYMIEVH